MNVFLCVLFQKWDKAKTPPYKKGRVGIIYLFYAQPLPIKSFQLFQGLLSRAGDLNLGQP
jgi:hypothetical protein